MLFRRFGRKKLKEESLEKVSNADILFIPIGGNYTISSEEAVSLINQIEPKIVIPMHYKIKGSKIKLDTEEKFLKAFSKKPEVLDKLSVRKTQLPQETKLVILKPSNKQNGKKRLIRKILNQETLLKN